MISIANTSNFAFFLRIFDEFFPGFRAKFQKIVTCAAFSIKFAKTNQKFAENSEFCENYSLLFKIIHFTPYLLRGAAGAGDRVLRRHPGLADALDHITAGRFHMRRCLGKKSTIFIKE